MAVLRCLEPFAFSDKGVERVVRAGDLVDAKDPLTKGREVFFENVEATVERMTDRTHESSQGAPGQPVADGKPPVSGAGSGRDAWATYAESKGVEVDDEMTRDDIVAAVEAYETEG